MVKNDCSGVMMRRFDEGTRDGHRDPSSSHKPDVGQAASMLRLTTLEEGRLLYTGDGQHFGIYTVLYASVVVCSCAPFALAGAAELRYASKVRGLQVSLHSRECRKRGKRGGGDHAS